MRLEIKLFATLKPYMKNVPEDGFLEMPDGCDVAAVIEKLTLPDEDVRLIFLNGRHASREHLLSDGDRVGFFPPVGGG